MRRLWNTVWFPAPKIFLIAFFNLLVVAYAQSPLELQVLLDTNAARAAAGLEPLAWDENAARAAREHARDMVERNYFAHKTPEGISLFDRMQRVGVWEIAVGENIAYYEGYSQREAVGKVVEGWMNSPHHRKNILRPSYSHLGVGVAQKDGRIILVQDFLARPFEVLVWQTPSRARIGVIEYEGASKAPVGLFIDGSLVAAWQPPNWAGKIYLVSSGQINLGIMKNNIYTWACSLSLPDVSCSSPEIKWHAKYSNEFIDTVHLQLSLPAGEYTLAYGALEPVPFKNVQPPVVLEVPHSWKFIWVGVNRKGRIEYTHKIPLNKNKKGEKK